MRKESGVFLANSILATQDALIVSNLISAAPALLNNLRKFDSCTSLAFVGGLLADPFFHPNNIRLEALAHLIAISSCGTKEPGREDISKWLNRYFKNTYLPRLEDSVEDVFLSNVINKNGNNRVFEGLLESNGFWLQEVLDVLATAPKRKPYQTVIEQTRALLLISETVAARLQIPRFSASQGQPKGKLVLPPFRKLLEQAKAVSFSKGDLDTLGISEVDLAPFIFREIDRLALSSETIGNSSLERRPIIEDRERGTFILVLPSAVSAAIRRYILEQFQSTGLLNQFGVNLQFRQAARLFKDGWTDSELTQASNAELPERFGKLPRFDQVLGSFDQGKYAHLILVPGNLNSCVNEGFTGIDHLDQDLAKPFLDYLSDCARSLSKRTDYAGGITVIVFGGVGRGYVLGLGEFPKSWVTATFHLPDFFTLCGSANFSMLRLWKLKVQYQLLQERDVEFFNAWGTLNLFGFWVGNDYRMVPRPVQFGQGNRPRIIIAPDYVMQLRLGARLDWDRHTALDNSGEWEPVERLEPHSYFKERQRRPVYASREAASNKELRGVVETANRNWWLVICQEANTADQSHVLHEVWNCGLNWLEKLAPVLEMELPELPSVPIQINLYLQNLETWTPQSALQELGTDEATPVISSGPVKGTIGITLPSAFQKLFNTPKNFAERLLVQSISVGALRLVAIPDETRALEFVAQVVKDDDARFFHLIQTHNVREVLASTGKPSPRLICTEDLALAELGLAWSIRKPSDGDTIRGKTQCQEFLQKVVDILWERVEKQLANVDLKSLVRVCFRNIDELVRDEKLWEMTSRALLATNEDKTDVRESAQRRSSDRNMGVLANRVVIETGMYACPQTGGRPVSFSDLDQMLANIDLLILTANHRDAIAKGFMEPTIKLYPNGEFSIDQVFYREIVYKYSSTLFEERFHSAAESYESHFEKPEAAEITDQGPSKGFVEAFYAEFGFQLQQLVLAQQVLTKFAFERGLQSFEIDSSDLCQILEEACNFKNTEAESFVHQLALGRRSGWNKDLPVKCSEGDIYPWRFRRRLSLLRRPLVSVDGPTGVLIVSPGLLEDSIRYLLGNLSWDTFQQITFLPSK